MNAIICAAAAVAVAGDRCRHLCTVIIIIVSVVRFVGVFLVDHSVTIAAADVATATIIVVNTITANTAKSGIVKSIITVVISLIVMNER